MAPVPISDDKVCILVLGDFLGTGSFPSGNDQVTWAPVPATPDSVMKLAGLRPRIRLALDPDGRATEMDFDSLEGMDPGKIFETVERLAPYREAREVARSGAIPPTAPEETVPASPPPEADVGSGLLDAILDVSQPDLPAPEPGSPEEIQAFVREVVRPHLVKDDSDAEARVAAVDEAISREMSSLIHAPSFQRLEAIWRSLVFLLSRVDATGKARVYLVHLPKGRLEEEVVLESSPLRDLLRSPQIGVPGRRWSVVVGAYDFAFTARDLRLLTRLAPMAREADVPLVTNLGLPGGEGPEESEADEDPGSGWEALRTNPAAPWLGLTYPRFLLREPFGSGVKRIKSFHFQEGPLSKETLLWGGGAFLAATLLAQGLMAPHTTPGTGSGLELLGLPQAPAEGRPEGALSSLEEPLTPDDVRSLMEMGLMPLFAFPNRASVHLGGIQSVSQSRAPLSAWWMRGEEKMGS